MIIIIRGHIRNSFDTNELYDFIKYLSKKYKIKIYIHTWSIKQNNLSWRPINNDNTLISDEYIKSYFKELSIFIKKIIIEDDSKIQLIGNIEGKILSTKTSLLGWKRYIYGQNKIINYIYNKIKNKDKFMVNTRFDLFTNSFIFPFNEIINFIDNNYNNIHSKNIFLRNNEYCGIDNIVIGTIKTNMKLFNYLHYNLDKILLLQENENLVNPEFIVYRTNNFIFI
jgi:hypothetical protein